MWVFFKIAFDQVPVLGVGSVVRGGKLWGRLRGFIPLSHV